MNLTLQQILDRCEGDSKPCWSRDTFRTLTTLSLTAHKHMTSLSSPMKTLTQEITIRLPLEIPDRAICLRVRQFRLGQKDRQLGEPCKSANGCYLDGWYSPDQTVPPYITQAESIAFNL